MLLKKKCIYNFFLAAASYAIPTFLGVIAKATSRYIIPWYKQQKPRTKVGYMLGITLNELLCFKSIFDYFSLTIDRIFYIQHGYSYS